MSSEKTLEDDGAGLGYPAPPGRAGDFKSSTPKIHAPSDIPFDITGEPLCPGTKDPQASLELPGGFSNEKRARARSPFPGAGGGPSGLRQASRHLRRPDEGPKNFRSAGLARWPLGRLCAGDGRFRGEQEDRPHLAGPGRWRRGAPIDAWRRFGQPPSLVARWTVHRFHLDTRREITNLGDPGEQRRGPATELDLDRSRRRSVAEAGRLAALHFQGLSGLR